MVDITTKKPLRVSTDGTAGPYIMVPLSQLEEVRRLLDGRGVRYGVEEHAISVDGAPYIAIVNLDRRTDPKAIQALLDSVR
jgi:hypothetical protein